MSNIAGIFIVILGVIICFESALISDLHTSKGCLPFVIGMVVTTIGLALLLS